MIPGKTGAGAENPGRDGRVFGNVGGEHQTALCDRQESGGEALRDLSGCDDCRFYGVRGKQNPAVFLSEWGLLEKKYRLWYA